MSTLSLSAQLLEVSRPSRIRGWAGLLCQLPWTLRDKKTRCLRPPCARPCAKHLPPTQCPPQASQPRCGGVLPHSSVLEIRQLKKPHITPPQSRWEGKVYDAASKDEQSENEVPQSRLTLCDPMEATRLLRPCDSSGKNTGVGCPFPLQGIFGTRGPVLWPPHGKG